MPFETKEEKVALIEAIKEILVEGAKGYLVVGIKQGMPPDDVMKQLGHNIAVGFVETYNEIQKNVK